MILIHCCNPQPPVRRGEEAAQDHIDPKRRRRQATTPEVTNHQVVVHQKRPTLARTIEVIELICYSISPNCMLVEADKRCSLVVQKNIHQTQDGATAMTYARPLHDLQEGRKYLDSDLKPESVGTLRLSLDRNNNQLEFRSIDERNAKLGDNHTKGLRAAERLSMSSFVLVEREDYSSVQIIGQTGDEVEPIDSSDARKSNADLLSSLSIELVQEDEAQICELENELYERQQQQVEAPVRVKRSRRFNWRKLFGGGGGRDNSTGVQDDGRHKESDAHDGYSNRSYTYDGDNPVGQLNLELNRDTIERHQHVAGLDRPDSIYLWPEPLTQKYHHMDQNSPTSGNTTQQPVSCLPGPPPPPVMISYNHKEAQSFAIELHAQLDLLGVRAYLDLYDIKNGQDWQDSLNFAILDCRLFVPLITPSYGETLWTSREFKLADVLNKRIVPINFTRRWPPPSLAIQIATLQYFDWLYKHDEGKCSTSPDAGKWPRECARSIAGQIRQILIQREAFVWPGNCQTSSVSSSSGGHSSGYESRRMSPELTLTSTPSAAAIQRRNSPALVHTRPVLREPRESDPMLAFEWAARTHRARNKNQLKLAPAGVEPAAQVVPNQPSHQSAASSPSTSSYGSLGGESPLASPGQGIGAAIDPAPKPCRKKSLGHRTKKAFSKFKRSISGGDGASRKRDLLA